MILARLADAEAELDAIAGVRGGRLRMVSFPTAGATIAPRAIGALPRALPGRRGHARAARARTRALDCLKCGDCDIALTVEAAFDPISDKAIERHPLLDDPMYLCLPACHPAARKARLRLKDFADESWILGTTGTCPDGAILQRACQGAGFEPQRRLPVRRLLRDPGLRRGRRRASASSPTSRWPPSATTSSSASSRAARPSATCSRRRSRAASSRPRRAAMLDILVEVGAEFEATNRSLAVAS